VITSSQIQVSKLAQFTGHLDCVYALAAGSVPHQFFSAAGDGMVVAWDLLEPDKGQLIARVSHSVYALLYLSQSKQLLIAENSEGLHWIDLDTRTQTASLKLSGGSIFDLKAYQHFLLAAMENGDLLVIDLQQKTLLKRISASPKSLRVLALAPIRGLLAAGYSDTFIRYYRLPDFAPIHQHPAHQNSVFALSFSPDEQWLVSGGRDAKLNVWDPENFTQLHSIPAHLYAINHLSYRPDGRFLVTGSMDKSLKIWDGQDFRLLKVINKTRQAGHGTSVNRVSWTPRQSVILSASDDRTIAAWQITFSEP
jgi:WD repeat-containing protein 61